MKKLLAFLSPTILLLLPLFALAQNPDVGYIERVISSVTDIIRILLPILMALTVLFIFYGLAKMAFAAGNEEARKEGRQYAIWGVIALVIMVGLYAIVGIVRDVFGIGGTTTPLRSPALPGSYGGGLRPGVDIAPGDSPF